MYLGRGVANYQECMSIARSHNAGRRWEALTFRVFDAPESD